MNRIDMFPFTEEHLVKFRNELTKAGDFDTLMRKKRALSRIAGPKYIMMQPNIEAYKRKYLIGVYESLIPYYSTQMPYVFWSHLYNILLQVEQGKI